MKKLFLLLLPLMFLGCTSDQPKLGAARPFLGATNVYPEEMDIPDPIEINHGDVPANTPTATNMVEITKSIAENVNEKISRPEATNLVYYVRDRFYDEELDVTWKRTVTGGRIFYDVEGIGDTTNEPDENGGRDLDMLSSARPRLGAAPKRKTPLKLKSVRKRSLSATIKEDLVKPREEMTPVEAWHNFLKPNGKVAIPEDVRPDPYDVEKEDPHKRKPRK